MPLNPHLYRRVHADRVCADRVCGDVVCGDGFCAVSWVHCVGEMCGFVFSKDIWI